MGWLAVGLVQALDAGWRPASARVLQEFASLAQALKAVALQHYHLVPRLQRVLARLP
jgi:hypothetical protein